MEEGLKYLIEEYKITTNNNFDFNSMSREWQKFIEKCDRERRWVNDILLHTAYLTQQYCSIDLEGHVLEILQEAYQKNDAHDKFDDILYSLNNLLVKGKTESVNEGRALKAYFEEVRTNPEFSTFMKYVHLLYTPFALDHISRVIKEVIEYNIQQKNSIMNDTLEILEKIAKDITYDSYKKFIIFVGKTINNNKDSVHELINIAQDILYHEGENGLNKIMRGYEELMDHKSASPINLNRILRHIIGKYIYDRMILSRKGCSYSKDLIKPSQLFTEFADLAYKHENYTEKTEELALKIIKKGKNTKEIENHIEFFRKCCFDEDEMEKYLQRIESRNWLDEILYSIKKRFG